jgi:hypothetical protein
MRGFSQYSLVTPSKSNNTTLIGLRLYPYKSFSNYPLTTYGATVHSLLTNSKHTKKWHSNMACSTNDGQKCVMEESCGLLKLGTGLQLGNYCKTRWTTSIFYDKKGESHDRTCFVFFKDPSCFPSRCEWKVSLSSWGRNKAVLDAPLRALTPFSCQVTIGSLCCP